MPKVKIDRVLSFSTEDPVHVAANVLSTDTGKKWKCAKPGEKLCSVVLQLEKASVITSIDIGNEHSAYVEVLANRSCGDGDYKVLLVMSAFMSPLESRQSQNVNKVRMFTQDQLSKPECEQKWDQIKIVCTQPFNKHVQYGLSFITLHASEEKAFSSQTPHIGKFTLRPESPDNLSIGSLFARRNEKESNSTPKKAAAAIRDASLNPCTPRNKTTIIKRPTCNTKQTDVDKGEVKNRNRNEIMYTKEDDDVNEKIDELVEKKRKEDAEKQEAEAKKKKEAKTPKTTADAGAKTSKRNKDNTPSNAAASERKPTEERARKRKSEDLLSTRKKAKPNKLTKPFRELLSGVTLVISGIQNPERGNIRTQALAMGAKYKPDWDNTSTHLICAFPNTPKFNQVKGKGKIVTKTWIFDCHSQRKRLPWRRYALDPSDQGQDESEEEVEEENDRNVQAQSTTRGSDTEDEIERIQLAQKQSLSPSDSSKMDVEEQNIDDKDEPLVQESNLENNNGLEGEYQTTTKQNEPNEENHCKLPKLATFFDRRTFYIDDELSEPVKKRLNKYIIAYKGKILENITEAENIISEEECVEDLKTKHGVDALYILPDWVWDCHNNKKIMPMDDFIL